METQTLTERLEANKRVMDAARRESKCLEKQVKELEEKLQDSQGESQAAAGKLQVFMKKVAALLQAPWEDAAPPSERDVLQKLEKVRDMNRMKAPNICVK